VSSHADELRQRREALIAQVGAERGIMASEYASISGGLDRADGLLKFARRVTPVAAAGVIALSFFVGPARIVRLLQAAAVPALLIRQILGRSTRVVAEQRDGFRLFGPRS
jgi:hypothetical protein